MAQVATKRVIEREIAHEMLTKSEIEKEKEREMAALMATKREIERKMAQMATKREGEGKMTQLSMKRESGSMCGYGLMAAPRWGGAQDLPPRGREREKAQMATKPTIRDQTSIRSPPGKVYDFFKNDLTKLNSFAPGIVNSAKVVDGKQRQLGGALQYELIVFGEKVTIKLKADQIDDSTRSLTFSVLRDNNKNSTTAMMIKINVSNKITWSLQFVDSKDVSEDVTSVAKAIINLIIKVLDIYLYFS